MSTPSSAGVLTVRERFRWVGLVALSTAIQVITFGVTFVLVPESHGTFFDPRSSKMLVYLLLTEWVGYAISFAVVLRLERSARKAVIVFVVTLVVVGLGFGAARVVSELRFEEQSRRDSYFRNEYSPGTQHAIAAERLRARNSVLPYSPTFKLSCPTEGARADDAAHGSLHLFQGLTLLLPLDVRRAGKYSVAIFVRYYQKEGPTRSDEIEAYFWFGVAVPGRYRIEWPRNPPAGHRFVDRDRVEVSLRINRLASFRETYPTLYNPRNPRTAETQATTVADTTFELHGVTISDQLFLRGTPCPAGAAPRLLGPDATNPAPDH